MKKSDAGTTSGSLDSSTSNLRSQEQEEMQRIIQLEKEIQEMHKQAEARVDAVTQLQVCGFFTCKTKMKTILLYEQFFL